MKINFETDIKSNESFVCTLSDSLRLLAKFIPGTSEKLEKLALVAVDGIATTEGVAESLIKDSVPGIVRFLRQVDIKDDNEKVLFKTFTFWNPDLSCWHVLMETSSELFWENKNKRIGYG